MDIETVFQHPKLRSLILPDAYGQAVRMLRLDLIHPIISGNKWYKLKENIRLAKCAKGVLTFGGQWSNHLVATAATCSLLGLESKAIIRGVLPENKDLTPSLKQCRDYGMDLIGVPFSTYRQRYQQTYLQELRHQYAGFYIVPEGGNNEAGRKGAEEIVQYIPEDVTHIALAVGTGTTLAGILNKTNERISVLGFVPFEKTTEQKSMIEAVFVGRDMSKRVKLFNDDIWKGFGKWNHTLVDFMNRFFAANNIPLDIIYTSKMVYYLNRLLKEGYFPERSNILLIHSGGLQGNESVRDLLSY